jgi:hypothetical protein
MVHPTDVEIELKKRLDQLTDRLIQKQMQVCLCVCWAYLLRLHHVWFLLSEYLVLGLLPGVWTIMNFYIKNMVILLQRNVASIFPLACLDKILALFYILLKAEKTRHLRVNASMHVAKVAVGVYSIQYNGCLWCDEFQMFFFFRWNPYLQRRQLC